MRDLNFAEVASVAEVEFLAPHHRHVQRRLLIVERDERLMQQWRESFSSDVRKTEDLYAMKREERRADRRRRRDQSSPRSSLGLVCRSSFIFTICFELVKALFRYIICIPNLPLTSLITNYVNNASE
jgi:hypothetical protein